MISSVIRGVTYYTCRVCNRLKNRDWYAMNVAAKAAYDRSRAEIRRIQQNRRRARRSQEPTGMTSKHTRAVTSILKSLAA